MNSKEYLISPVRTRFENSILVDHKYIDELTRKIVISVCNNDSESRNGYNWVSLEERDSIINLINILEE